MEKTRGPEKDGSTYREERSSTVAKRAAPRRRDRSTRQSDLLLSNTKLARATWGAISRIALTVLAMLTKRHCLSVAAGDLQFLDGRWYVTHSGLLRIAQRRRCFGIKTELQKDLLDLANQRWIFKATIYKVPGSRGFVSYGDADPSNVSPLVRGAEMRVAETRAVNRALRKAYGIGLCSVEELGWLRGSPGSTKDQAEPVRPPNENGSSHGQPKLRDRLRVLIRQYNLDPNLVKAYAADFCGAQSLKEASRERVESFITHLAECAKESRDALVCQLNSFARPVEVKS